MIVYNSMSLAYAFLLGALIFGIISWALFPSYLFFQIPLNKYKNVCETLYEGSYTSTHYQFNNCIYIFHKHQIKNIIIA